MTSPNYPVLSPSNLNCTYQFNAQPGYNIEIIIYGKTESCCDYVEIRDGSRILGFLRGVIPRTTFVSSGESLTLHYYTDSYYAFEGIQAEYRQYKCLNLCDSEHGYCDNSYGNPSCLCKDGFSGNGTTCSDIDECNNSESISVCQPYARCSNTDGNFTCTCENGYVGESQSCNAYFEVSVRLNNSYEFSSHLKNKSSTAYVNLANQVTVQLKLKYESSINVTNIHFYNGSVIVVTTIVVFDANVSSVQQSFNNTIGEPLFDSLPSTDIDSCLIRPCGANEDCTNIPMATFTCSCSEGYINKTGSCSLITCGDCSSDATCNQANTPVQCLCNSGFIGNGVICKDIDECATLADPCPNAACANTNGSFECFCNPETNNINGVCTPQCMTGYCLNGATCIERNAVGTPACICTKEYTGDSCGEKIETDPGMWIAIGVIAGAVFILLIIVVVMMLKLRRN